MARKQAKKTETVEVAEPVAQAVAAATLDAEAIQQQVDQVLQEKLYWFPVRHHSPTVARHLQAAIEERQPKLVLIEGPADASHLIPYIIDPQTKPPVAIYSSYRDDNNVLRLAGIASAAADVPPRFASFYPITSYSPEFVAMRAARKLGAEVVFMDLPHHALIQAAPEVPSDDSPTEASSPPAEAAASTTNPPDDHALHPNDDALFEQSGFYQRLAEVAGYRSWSEAWDTLFESDPASRSYEEYRRELAYFCAAVRATTPAAQIQTDGTLERERFMLQTIRESMKKYGTPADQVMIICGGFHLFLDRSDSQTPPPLPPGTVFHTVMPYSFFRISELSGYGAGNRAPQYFQTCWDLGQKMQPSDILVEHVVAILKKARRGGEKLSAADAIAVCQHAGMLARLRRRKEAVLDDIRDALLTCCCKGDPQQEGIHLQKAIDDVNIGTKVGHVTSTLGHLPIVNDFYRHLSELDLGEIMGREKMVKLEFDKRDAREERCSVLLHRLKYLGVPIGEQTDQQSTLAGGTIFKERWTIKWDAKIEPALIEQNLYGDTLEVAALARMKENLARDEMHAGKTCERLLQAVDMDLPDLLTQAEEACSQAIDNDSSFISLCAGLRALLVLDRYAMFRHLTRTRLADLIVRCFARACFALTDASNVPEDQQKHVIDALLSLAEAVQRGGEPALDKTLFAEHLKLAAEQTQVPFLHGAFLGMLTEIRSIEADELADYVKQFARQPVEEMMLAGDFLEGVMSVSRMAIMMGADSLIGAMDELLRAADWDTFLSMLPRMRAAFDRLHDRQRESLSLRVAQRYHLAESEILQDLQTSVGAAALIARLDQQVAEIMKHWHI